MLTLVKVVPDSAPNDDGWWIRCPVDVELGFSNRWSVAVERLSPHVPSGHHVVALETCGRERDHVFKMSWLHGLIYDLAWPRFECLQCLGQEYWQGCECAHKDAVAPGVGPELWRLWARRTWSVVARRCGMYDPSVRSW